MGTAGCTDNNKVLICWSKQTHYLAVPFAQQFHEQGNLPDRDVQTSVCQEAAAALTQPLPLLSGTICPGSGWASNADTMKRTILENGLKLK